MFLWRLRRLLAKKEKDSVVITYKCKVCSEVVRIVCTPIEYERLEKGLPFNAVFPKSLCTFPHFKEGLCEQCLKTQQS